MPKRILMIDDEPEFVIPQKDALQDEGYEVELAVDVDEAKDLLLRRTFDLILLDLIMPPSKKNHKQIGRSSLVETGKKLYQHIREELGLKEVPIIFLSVVRDPAIIRELRQSESKLGHQFRIIEKPALTGDVVDKVQRTLGDYKI